MNTTTIDTQLKPNPDWGAAAQALLDGCTHLSNATDRIEFIDGCCRALGSQLYPAFLHVLLIIAHRGTPWAQQQVAEALADTMACGRLPCGALLTWGQESTAWPDALNPNAHARAQHHSLGPLEYLFASFAQPTSAQESISAIALEEMLLPLMRLFAQSPRAHALYCARLAEVARVKLDGGWSREAKGALSALAAQWQQQPQDPQSAVSALISGWSQRDGAPLTGLAAASPHGQTAYGQPDFGHPFAR